MAWLGRRIVWVIREDNKYQSWKTYKASEDTTGNMMIILK
jgi:hypothetical protein